MALRNLAVITEIVVIGVNELDFVGKVGENRILGANGGIAVSREDTVGKVVEGAGGVGGLIIDNAEVIVAEMAGEFLCAGGDEFTENSIAELCVGG